MTPEITAVIVAVLGLGSLACWIALHNVRIEIIRLRHTLNSRLDQLLETTGQLAQIRGVAEGRELERTEQEKSS